MRRVLATFTVIVLATLACSDPLLCPDGCTEEPQQQASTPSPGHVDCLACRNALSTALPTFDLTPGGLTEPSNHHLAQLTPDSMPFSIDHPPRDA
jgi:hypothetical protein